MIKGVLHHLLPQGDRRCQMRTSSALFYGLRQKEWMNREFFYKEIKTETLNLGYKTVCKVLLCWNLKIQEKNKQTTSSYYGCIYFFFKVTLFPFRTARKFILFLFFSLKGEIIAL